MSGFAIPASILKLSEPLTALPLSEARLVNDARYPWIVLIPRQVGAVEIEDLTPSDRALLVEEIALAGKAVRAVAATTGYPLDKLNVGQLGNNTRELHVHVLGRHPGDAAWPGPVWGIGAPEAYGEESLALALCAAKAVLAGG